MDAAGRAIFITGAASGMGAATAQRFAAEHWFVGCFDIDRSGLAALAEELGDERAMFLPLDVTDPTAFAGAVAAFGAITGGRMDILHNNAGVISHGRFQDMDWETVERIIAVNLLGPMIGVRSARLLLERTPNSLCFFTGSASSIFGAADLAAYSASKHGLRGFAEAMALELHPHGIRVGHAVTGITDTAMLPPEHRSALPTEGMFRLMQPSVMADTVWAAYHDEVETLHRYVPPELAQYEAIAATQPSAVRDDGRARLSVR
ncbi:SDR family NAD(P)-dependent oxidoreductase [uncultured Sphingomonas sp.]|uniref:SDR family NAD(P)-dependent oxidoreductase n=1 Tax=uncultured Sphingomonas sp. TaxID=158754 RepID=UPI0035CA2B49